MQCVRAREHWKLWCVFTLPLDVVGTMLIALGDGQFGTDEDEEDVEVAGR